MKGALNPYRKPKYFFGYVLVFTFLLSLYPRTFELSKLKAYTPTLYDDVYIKFEEAVAPIRSLWDNTTGDEEKQEGGQAQKQDTLKSERAEQSDTRDGSEAADSDDADERNRGGSDSADSMSVDEALQVMDQQQHVRNGNGSGVIDQPAQEEEEATAAEKTAEVLHRPGERTMSPLTGVGSGKVRDEADKGPGVKAVLNLKADAGAESDVKSVANLEDDDGAESGADAVNGRNEDTQNDVDTGETREKNETEQEFNEKYNKMLKQYSTRPLFNPFLMRSPPRNTGPELLADGTSKFYPGDSPHVSKHMSYNPVSDLKATNLVPGVFVPVQTYVTPDFEVVDERLLGYTEEIKPHQKEFTDDFTRSMTWERSSAFFVDLHRKVFAPAHSESKDETRNKYTKYGGVGYILGNSLSGAYVLGNDEKENITFYPALTPEGVRIDMLFSTGMLNKTHMLSTAPYDHATALAIWERKGPYSKLSPLLAEPTSVGYGTPNPYLPWKIPPCKGFPDTPPLPPAELESNSVSSHATYVIKALNELGIYYIIDAGTLLGSYRHGGFIPHDKDVDIVVPIRRNVHFFGSEHSCPEMEEGPSEDPYTEHVKDTSTLCGKTPSDWAKIFYPLLQAALNSTGITPRIRRRDKLAGIKLWTHCVGETYDFMNSRLDRPEVVSRRCYHGQTDMYLEFNPSTGDGVCTCPWYGSHALCPVDSTQVLVNLFGEKDKFMTPNRNLDEVKYEKKVFPLEELHNKPQTVNSDMANLAEETLVGLDVADPPVVRRRRRRGTSSTETGDDSKAEQDNSDTDSSNQSDEPVNDDDNNETDSEDEHEGHAHGRGKDSDLKRYPPALSYKDANRMYKEMGATFPFEDPEQPTANMAYHWMRLYEVKTRVYELGQKRMHVDKIKDKRVRKRTRKLMKKVRTT